MPDDSEKPENIIDLMPYLEGQKFGWTVDMTHAVLKNGDAQVLSSERIRGTYIGERPYDPEKLL